MRGWGLLIQTSEMDTQGQLHTPPIATRCVLVRSGTSGSAVEENVGFILGCTQKVLDHKRHGARDTANMTVSQAITSLPDSPPKRKFTGSQEAQAD